MIICLKICSLLNKVVAVCLISARIFGRCCGIAAIEDPDEKNAHLEEEEEEPELQKTLEEALTEMVQDILNKSSPIAVKAMKDLKQMVSLGENIPEVFEVANQLVEKIREGCDGQLTFTSPTKCKLINFLLFRMGEEGEHEESGN